MSRVAYKSNIKSKGCLFLFFDFYTLNEIWFKTVGRTEYGYAETKILPFKKERVIDDTFREKVAAVKAEVIGALEYSVRREIRHWGDHVSFSAGAKFCDDVRVNGTSNYDRANIKVGFTVEHPTYKNLIALPLESISTLFFANCWDRQYGGKKWGIATDFLIKLKASKNIKDDIFLIDRIFDLQHNCGFILNKTNFVVLAEKRVKRRGKKNRAYYYKPLNFRFKASIEEMVENCSDIVQRIYFANRNYIG